MDESVSRAQFEPSAGGDDGEMVLRVFGELDAAVAPPFRERLVAMIEATEDDVVVDLAGVSFIDSSALSVLLLAHQELQATGRKLVTAHLSAAVTRLFEIAGVDVLLGSRDETGATTPSPDEGTSKG